MIREQDNCNRKCPNCGCIFLHYREDSPLFSSSLNYHYTCSQCHYEWDKQINSTFGITTQQFADKLKKFNDVLCNTDNDNNPYKTVYKSKPIKGIVLELTSLQED